MDSRFPVGNTRTIILKAKNMLWRLRQGFGKAGLLHHGSGEAVKDYFGKPITNLIDAKLKATLVKVGNITYSKIALREA